MKKNNEYQRKKMNKKTKDKEKSPYIRRCKNVYDSGSQLSTSSCDSHPVRKTLHDPLQVQLLLVMNDAMCQKLLDKNTPSKDSSLLICEK